MSMQDKTTEERGDEVGRGRRVAIVTGGSRGIGCQVTG